MLITGLRNGDILRRNGHEHVVELDWDDGTEVGPLTVIMQEVQHSAHMDPLAHRSVGARPITRPRIGSRRGGTGARCIWGKTPRRGKGCAATAGVQRARGPWSGRHRDDRPHYMILRP